MNNTLMSFSKTPLSLVNGVLGCLISFHFLSVPKEKLEVRLVTKVDMLGERA
jgi:hypothetical protein